MADIRVTFRNTKTSTVLLGIEKLSPTHGWKHLPVKFDDAGKMAADQNKMVLGAIAAFDHAGEVVGCHEAIKPRERRR